MKHISLYSGLSELRGILKAAIDHCHTIPDAPADIRSVVTDHSLSCLGIEEVIELVGKSKDLTISAVHDHRLLGQHIHAASAARSSIQNATATYRCTRLDLRARRAANRYQEFSVCVMSNLSRIVTALNSAILLVSLRLSKDHTRMLVAKLRSLIASCQKADSSSRQLMRASVNRASKSQGEPDGSNDTELQELLQPSSIAHLLSELHAVHAHAGVSAFGTTLPPRNAQLLNINILSLLLERQPLYPPHVFLTLVSYGSEVIVATRAGDYSRLPQILNESPELLHCSTIDNLTLMCFAIESGEIKTVQYLLDKGIGVNDTYGRTATSPLATALQFRHLPIARLLIHAGADFDHKNKYGWSPLFYIWFKEDRTLSAGPLLGLLAASTNFHVLHRNIYDKDGWSIMHRAATYGTSEDVSTLIQLGVDPFSVTRTKDKNPVDDEIHNYSVLQQVVLLGLADMVGVLLPVYREEFGSIDLPDEQGWTLLHMAVQEQHLPIIQMLVENGADIWAKIKPTLIARVSDTNNRKYTPFSLAKSFGPPFFQYFIRIVRRHQQLSRHTNVQAVDRRLYKPEEISVSPRFHSALASTDEQARTSRFLDVTAHKKPESGINHAKVFGATTISDNASGHIGDSIRNYRITNYSFNGRSSKARLKRLKLYEKFSRRSQHASRKKVLPTPLPNVQRDNG